MRLKNYSSGMHVRLAFSVAIQVDAEILLIDEVLAVGDARFQQKCFDEFQRLKRDGRTILFVTHDMSAIERFCDRAMLLDKGQMLAIGEPAAIARRYNELNFGGTIHEATERALRRTARRRARDAEIVDAWFEDSAGARIAAIAHRDTCVACIEVHFNAARTTRSSARRSATTSAPRSSPRRRRFDVGPTGHFAAGETAVVRLRFETWFTQTRYTLTPSIARAGMGADAIDLRADLASVIVHGGNFTTGVVDLPHSFEIERR